MEHSELLNINIKSPKKKRHKNYSLVILTGLLAAALIFFILCCTVLFTVTSVKINGSSVYSADVIAEAAAIKDGQPLLTLDTESIDKTLTDHFYYIENVEVKKAFPGTVSLTITPSKPVASIETEEGYIYISGSGKVLDINPLPMENTLIFTGVKLSEPVTPGEIIGNHEDRSEMTDEQRADALAIDAVLELSDSNTGTFPDKTDYIDISDRGNIKIIYDNRLELNMGGMSDIAYKIKFLQNIIDEKIGPNTSGRLLVLSNGVASFIDSDGLRYNEKKYQQNNQNQE